MAINELESLKSVEEKTKTGQIWPDWHQQLKNFQASNRLEAAWQLLNTLVPYFCLWFLMVRSIQLGYSYIWTLILAIPAAAFLVRLFILFHDCVHNSFFKSKSANTFFGYLLGVLVFTSFEDWRFTHLRHHGTYANLDSRGFGDIHVDQSLTPVRGQHCGNREESQRRRRSSLVRQLQGVVETPEGIRKLGINQKNIHLATSRRKTYTTKKLGVFNSVGLDDILGRP